MSDSAFMPVVRRVDTVEAFQALRDEWRSLLGRCRPNFVFMTWEWLFTWWRHFAGDRGLFLMEVRDRSGLLGVLPLLRFVRRYGPWHRRRLLNFVGFRYEQRWNDWMDAPALDVPRVIAAALEWLAARRHVWDAIDLWDMAEDSATINEALSACRRLGLPAEARRESTCPYLLTVGSFEEYYANRVKPKVRNDLERQIRRLEQLGKVEAEWAAPDCIEPALLALFDFRQRRQAARGQGCEFRDPAFRDFYLELARVFPSEQVDASLLRLDGRPIAAHFGFRYGGKLYYCTPGFDPDLAAYSPGKVLLKRMIERCFADEGVTEFDFLRGDEPYKYEWATNERFSCRVVLTNPRSEGAIGKVYRRMPDWARRIADGVFGTPGAAA
jgi:CelD/BcsL family acetyltransferase involved in cellulose biosynthesis